MTSLPSSWTGDWRDRTGRTLAIHQEGSGVKVSVKNSRGEPFKIDTTGFKNLNDQTIGLPAAIVTDNKGEWHLQVEAGAPKIGPTYKLYFSVKEEGGWRLANESDPVENVLIQPNVGTGLYDEWEDDLGVPWAMPLEVYSKVKS